MNETAARKRRLFAGIDLDPATRAACGEVAQALAKTGFSARYEAQEKLHATLAFLGFVEPQRLEAIAETLSTVAARLRPFTVGLDKLGAFPHERRPRVVFIGAREQGAAFRSLARAVRDAYASLGFDFNDDPVAHVTIARVKESKRPLPSVEFAPIPLKIAALALFESRPDPERKTSRYAIVATAPFSAA